MRRDGIFIAPVHWNPVTVMSTSVLLESVPNEEHLELLVQRRLAGRIRDLRLRVHQGGVILQGRANTYHAKQLAQHAVMELSDLPILANDIDVLRNS